MAQPPISRRSLKARCGALSARKKTKAKSTDCDLWASVEYRETYRRPEQTLTMLLAEPEIQMIMQADRVNVQDLIAELNIISAQLRKNVSSSPPMNPASTRAPPQPARDDAEYRPGVGVMLLNRHGQVFVARRNDITRDAWQMPQGGINSDEIPVRAALRELREEIGTDNVEVIAETKGWYYYDVPTNMARKAWHGKWRGQRQKWFVMIFKGQDSDINLELEHPEFDTWRWISPQELSALAVFFKRQLYVDVMGEFSTIFRD